MEASRRHAPSIRSGVGRARREARRLLAVILVASSTACAGLPSDRDLVASAIRARGGALARASRVSELHVYRGLEGVWRWRISYRRPDQLLVSILTDGDDQHYLSDGVWLRTFVGGLPVAREPLGGTDFESWVRWTALSYLDALEDPERILWSEVDPSRVDPPAVRGLLARWRDDPRAEYRLEFDRRARLVRARGPVAIPGMGTGTLTATFSDHRRVGRFLLPFGIRYELDGRALLDERVQELVPDDPRLTPATFREAP